MKRREWKRNIKDDVVKRRSEGAEVIAEFLSEYKWSRKKPSEEW